MVMSDSGARPEMKSEEIKNESTKSKLPGVKLPETMRFTEILEEAVKVKRC